VRVLGISGSLRRDSHNSRLLRAASDLLPPGAELAIWNGLAGIPAYDEDREDPRPEPVLELFGEIEAADALLFATPEYNASVPGALKNALDWASRPFPDNVLRDKPSAVMGASTGLFGAVWAQAELRKVLRASGAHVIDEELPVGSADSAWDAEDRLVDAELAGRIASLLETLVREVRTPVEQSA
jgi:chromate reductase